MATTFQTSPPDYHSTTDKKSIAWGISLAVVLALAIIFMMRSISRDPIPATPTGVERMSDTVPSTVPTDSTQ